jgi:alpha-beta hydrolase superfamily lysophospholipase
MHGQIDGANYTIAVPSNWNGTLFLYSHGYTLPSVPLVNPGEDAPDQVTANGMLQEGYALAGTSYSQNGWAVQQAFQDQMDLLKYFNSTCSKPTQTIAWGSSMGGLITAGLMQMYPHSFNAAMPMCGLLAGDIGQFNPQLDAVFAFNQLLAGGKLQVASFSDALSTYKQAKSILSSAQQTAQGQARIALFNALENIPGWSKTGSPEPAATDYATQEKNQYSNDQIDFILDILAQAEFDSRAGGNPSWTIGVNYGQQLQRSIDYNEVVALYKQAGLGLDQDLATLQKAAPVKADAKAIQYGSNYIIFNGKISFPVLTMHTTGDTLVTVEVEQAYASVVNAAGNGNWLRQTFVHRAGHCAFTSAEILAGVHTLINRLNTGIWGNAASASAMNQVAAKYGSSYNVVAAQSGTVNGQTPAFITYSPAPFLRPFDSRSHYPA